MSLAGLKQIARARLRAGYKLHGGSATRAGERVDLPAVLDAVVEAFAKGPPRRFSEVLRELNGKVPQPAANRKRLTRWLPALVKAGVLKRDASGGGYMLAVPCVPTLGELDTLYPADALQTVALRMETQLEELRIEVRELRTTLGFVLKLATEQKTGPEWGDIEISDLTP